jgi:hypothetical protein
MLIIIQKCRCDAKSAPRHRDGIDISELQQQNDFIGESGDKSQGLAWRTFAGFCLMPVLLLGGGGVI